MWLFYVDPLDTRFLNRYDHLSIRWFFPFGFTVIFLFFWHISRLKHLWMSSYIFYSFWIILLTGQYLYLYRNADLAVNTVKQFDLLIQNARQQGLTKCYIDKDEICRNVYYHTVNTSSVIYSCLEGADSMIHVIVSNKEEDSLIDAQSANTFYQSSDRMFSQAEINKKYFNLRPAKYLPLRIKIDCADIQ